MGSMVTNYFVHTASVPVTVSNIKVAMSQLNGFHKHAHGWIVSATKEKRFHSVNKPLRIHLYCQKSENKSNITADGLIKIQFNVHIKQEQR